jgi:glycosyl hydrolase family 26
VKIGRVLGGAVVALVIIPVIAAVVAVRLHDPSPSPRSLQQAHHVATSSHACARPPHIQHPMIGVATGAPMGRNLARFIRITKVQPQIVAQYLQFGDRYNPDMACRIAQARGELLVQWNPKGVSLQKIARGGWDRYIKQFALDVRAAQVPIVLSFGHEMNGSWYKWGNTYVSPKTFIAAWRHLHRLFAAAGAGNVTWCWDVNVWLPALTGKPNYGITSARRWWPGARYVDWIGLDAYYQTPSDTFRSIFRYSLGALHRIAHKPVLIAETAAAQGPFQARQIRSLFSGLRRTNVIGAVWFDSKSNVREDWQLEGQPAAIAAFRAGARSLARIRAKAPSPRA